VGCAVAAAGGSAEGQEAEKQAPKQPGGQLFLKKPIVCIGLFLKEILKMTLERRRRLLVEAGKDERRTKRPL
jgi:hypothetical protein